MTAPAIVKDAEAKEYIKKAQAGDMTAYNWLYEQYKRFIFNRAAIMENQYRKLAVPKEDFISIGHIGFMKGVQSFDLEKAKDFCVLTYLSRCIQNEMLMFTRQFRKLVYEVPLESVIYRDERDNELSLLEVLTTDSTTGAEELIVEDDRLTALALLVTHKQGKYAHVIYTKLFESKTQREVVREHGFTQSYVSRITSNFITYAKAYKSQEEAGTLSNPLFQRMERIKDRIRQLLADGMSCREIVKAAQKGRVGSLERLDKRIQDLVKDSYPILTL